MKVQDVPQDLKYVDGFVVRDLSYAVDEHGDYKAVRSDGWTPKNEAIEITLDDIDLQCEEVLERYRRGETSPLEYHMMKNLMSLELMADYSGISKRTIRKHFEPKAFAALDAETLNTYAETLRITVDELKTMPD